jgi:glutamate synthase domain-containing protein 3
MATEAELTAHLGPTELRPRALDNEATARLYALLEEHLAATGSPRAEALLTDWPAAAARFVHLAPGLPVAAPSLRAEQPVASVPSPR